MTMADTIKVMSLGPGPEIIGADAITIEVGYGDELLPLAKMATFVLKPRSVLRTDGDLRNELRRLARALQEAPMLRLDKEGQKPT
jgi:hypothetical protein